jgi:hypothetical protein
MVSQKLADGVGAAGLVYVKQEDGSRLRRAQSAQAGFDRGGLALGVGWINNPGHAAPLLDDGLEVLWAVP